MKQMRNDIILSLLLGMLLPGLMLNAARYFERESHVEMETGSTATTERAQSYVISVLMDDDSISQMALEEYLVGVLLGELPADFELEAKKAQAVVARTYTMRMNEGVSKHADAAVCTDPGCCQAYCSPDEYLSRGGSQSAVDAAGLAVSQTQGLVLTYEGNLIEATYFSSSGGRTEDAVAVWGNDVPYLQATDSPEDVNVESVTMALSDFEEALGVDLTGSVSQWLGSVTYTNGGGVDTMVIDGITFKGTQLRQLLGLRSTAFTMTIVGDHITITTRGYGHRVGMSQYGADAMAVSGSTYDEILIHYYRGTVLTDWIDK